MNKYMKKTSILVILFIIAPLISYAQPGWQGKVELSANISGAPYDIEFGNYDYYFGYSDLASIYGPQTRNTEYLPVFSLMGEYKFRRNFSIGMEAAYTHVGNDYYDPFTDEYTGVYSKHTLCLMPGIKYRYLIRNYFSLHSGVSAGAALQFGKDGSEAILGVTPVYQIVPIGIRVGSNLYATLDYYLGNLAFGARFGIGYRF